MRLRWGVRLIAAGLLETLEPRRERPRGRRAHPATGMVGQQVGSSLDLRKESLSAGGAARASTLIIREAISQSQACKRRLRHLQRRAEIGLGDLIEPSSKNRSVEMAASPVRPVELCPGGIGGIGGTAGRVR
jgi:hypothetical protein